MSELDDLLTTIRGNLDIVDLIRPNLRLDLYGNVYRGGPPGYFDDLPSFVVDPTTQTWMDTDTMRDFSTGFTMGGDCIDFVRHRDGVTHAEALRLLADDLELDHPWDGLADDLASWSERREIEEVLTWVAVYYFFNVSLQERGELADGIGLAHQNIDRLVIGRSSGHLQDDIVEALGHAIQPKASQAGLFAVAEDGALNEVLQGRITFPCWRHGRAARIIGLNPQRRDEGRASFVTTLTKNNDQPHVSELVAADVLYGEDSLAEGGDAVVALDVLGAAAAFQNGFSCLAPPEGRLDTGHHPRLAALSGDLSNLVLIETPGALEAAHAVQVAGGRAYIAIQAEGVSLREAVEQAVTVAQYVQGPDGDPEEEQERETRRPPRFKGEVSELNGRYHDVARNGELTAISSFVIRPSRRIVIDDDEEVVVGDVVCESGLVLPERQFPPRAFSSRKGLQRILRRPDLQWTGSSANLQGIMRLLNAVEVPRTTGTRSIGYCDSLNGPRWVTPQGSLSPLGSERGDDVVYLESGAALAEVINFTPVDEETATEAARGILPRLLELNSSPVVLPIIAWFFAAPLKPRIQKLCGGFPVLFVWGSPGSGKSSLILNVFWPMVGVTDPSPFSCTDTEAAINSHLSSTDSVVVFLDEYKPADLPKKNLELLHRFIRRLYKEETVGRGRREGGVVTRRLAAPLCLAGETRPTEPAIVERIIPAALSKTALENERCLKAFEEIKATGPHLLAASIVRWLLAQDTETDLDLARTETERLVRGRELPPRIRDHLVVLRLGLLHFTGYASAMGVELPDIDIEAAFDGVLEDLLDGGRGVKSGLDFFLEKLALLAAQEKIRRGTEYVVTDEGVLALHLQLCHDVYSENWRHQDGGERLDKKAISRLLRENMDSGGYVRGTQGYGSFDDGRGRAVLIDLRKASERLDVDGFSTHG